MEEIIIIRAIDPDETVFKTIMDALHDKSIQVVRLHPPCSLLEMLKFTRLPGGF